MLVWRRFLLRTLRKTAGYTLVETVVALALLVSVLVPASTLLAHLMIEQRASRQAQALVRAEAALEEMILQVRQSRRPDDAHEDEDASHEPWRIVRASRTSDGVVKLRVAVYWKERPSPAVVLKTARKAP